MGRSVMKDQTLSELFGEPQDKPNNMENKLVSLNDIFGIGKKRLKKPKQFCTCSFCMIYRNNKTQIGYCFGCGKEVDEN